MKGHVESDPNAKMPEDVEEVHGVQLTKEIGDRKSLCTKKTHEKICEHFPPIKHLKKWLQVTSTDRQALSSYGPAGPF